MDDIATRGENLRRYFKQLGLTQKEAAGRIGISAPHIANLLNGRDGMGQKKVSRICAAFPEISETYLLTGIGVLVPGDANAKRTYGTPGDEALLAEISNLREQLERERGEKARLLGIIETMTGR